MSEATTTKTKYAWYNWDSRRWVVCGYELHCGDCFEVQFQGAWHCVRIEMAMNEWVLIGLPPGAPKHIDALPVRRCQ